MAVPPVAPQGIHHLAIQCHDLITMVRFYNTVLRLPVVRRWPRDPDLGTGDRAVWMGLGTSVIALESVDEAATPDDWQSQTPGLHLVALQIFPWGRQLWREQLALHEVTILYESQWTLYIRDPEGNRVGLSHFPDEEAQTQRSRW
ncbi:MAG: VOC family protein [Myxococcales bacterium]|nr:VOC family protein [Myxococcales bacterium]